MKTNHLLHILKAVVCVFGEGEGRVSDDVRKRLGRVVYIVYSGNYVYMTSLTNARVNQRNDRCDQF